MEHCEKCGSLLGDKERHDEWHVEIVDEILDEILIHLSDSSSL